MTDQRAPSAGFGGQAGSQPAQSVGAAVAQRKQPAAPSAIPMLVPLKSAAAIWGVSSGTFHKLRRQGIVPEPVSLGPRALRWIVSDLYAAIAELPKQKATSEPTHLLRNRIERMKRGGSGT